MAFSIDKLNFLGQAAGMQGIQPVKQLGAEPTKGEPTGASEKSNNPFSKGTVGVNTNIGVGDMMNISAQAGKKAGVGKTLGFA